MRVSKARSEEIRSTARERLKVMYVSDIFDLLDDLEEAREQRSSLVLQLDSCQGALREVIAENTANCDRADTAEAELAKAQEEIRRLKELT